MNDAPRWCISLVALGALTACQSLQKELPPETKVVISTEVPRPTLSDAERDAANLLASTAQQLPSSQVYQGTGQFLARPRGAEVTRTAGGDLALNFEAADLREVINTIFEALEVNYVIDPGVQGQVTFQTTAPLARDDLLPVLEGLLRTNGAALIKEGAVYRVMPAATAPRGRAPELRALSSAGFAVRVFPLRYISATEMETILKPFAPEGGVVLVEPRRNLLMLAGTPQELSQLQETIDIFDVNWMRGMSVGLFVLENVEAQTLITELQGVFDLEGNAAMANMLRFIPVSRLNAVIVISPQPEFLRDASQWIERLDGVSGQRLYIYEVQSSDAEYLANLLGQVFDAKTGTVTRTSGNRGEVAPGMNSGGASSRSGSSSGLNPSRVSAPTDFPMIAGLNDLPPYQVMQAAAGGSPPPASGSGNSKEDAVRIIPDVENNSLLIWADARTYDRMVAALRRLDVSPRQVLVEATIAEVTLSGALRYGLQWFFSNYLKDRRGSAGLGLVGTDTITSGSSGLDGDNTDAGLLGDLASNEFSYVISSDGLVRGLFRTLASESRLKVLSSPQILVIDNQEAEIRVGTNQPVRTTTTVTTGGNETSSIEYRETGVFLKVRPQVNSSGLVTMTVQQEVTDVGDQDASTGQVTFFERKINSKVVMRAGQTVVLGGLIREEVRGNQGGIPVLYKMPFIGPLFGSTENANRKTELLILLTPRVVENSQDAAKVTREMKRRMEAIAPFMEDQPPEIPLSSEQSSLSPAPAEAPVP